MPEEIPLYAPVWDCVTRCIVEDKIAVTTEIYKELAHITGDVGECIRANKASMVLEVDEPSWDSGLYISYFNRMRKDYRDWIAEYSFKSSAKTICIPDLTAIALGKTLKVPVVSMESSAFGSPKHKRILDICALEKVLHYTFNDFLTIEGLLS